MSNSGKRSLLSSGIPEKVSSKRTSAAQAGAASARNILPISALLNSSHRASSLPDQPEPPLHVSREASAQRDRTLMPQTSVSLDFQSSEGSGLPIRQSDSQSSLLPGFWPIRDVAPLKRESGPQPSGGDAPPRTASFPSNQEQRGSEPTRGSGPSLARQLMPPPRPVWVQPSGRAGLPFRIPDILQPRAAVAIGPSGGADSQLSRPSIPRLSAPTGVQSSGENHRILSMDFDPQPSIPERHMLNARHDLQSGRAASSQLSQGDDGRKRMDYFRFQLLVHHLAQIHMIRLTRDVLSNSHQDVTTASGATVYAHVQARTKFLISETKGRLARIKEQFETSYCPVIRELTKPHYYYDPEICRMFKSHTDSRARLLLFEAKIQNLRQSRIDTDAKLQLYCQYLLVVDEERRELLDDAAYPNTRSQSSQTARDDLVGVAAQAHSRETGGTGDAQPTIPVATHTAQADGSRVTSRGGHPPQTGPCRPRRDSPTKAATQGSSSETGGPIPGASSNASESRSDLETVAADTLAKMLSLHSPQDSTR